MINKIIFYLLSFINKVVNSIIYLFLFTLLFICLYALYDYYQIYENVQIDISFEEDDYNFEKYNENVIGWINIYNTSINYPVMKGNNNKEYLNKNYKNEYSKAGSIFIDYRSSFFDNYSIIYGHNLSSGGMFSDLKKYKNKSFFNNHLEGQLYTKNNKYKVNVILVSEINAYSELYNVKYLNNNDYILNTLLKKSLNKISIINSYDKLLLLSTCSNKTNYRIVLLCYLK